MAAAGHAWHHGDSVATVVLNDVAKDSSGEVTINHLEMKAVTSGELQCVPLDDSCRVTVPICVDQNRVSGSALDIVIQNAYVAGGRVRQIQ